MDETAFLVNRLEGLAGRRKLELYLGLRGESPVSGDGNPELEGLAGDQTVLQPGLEAALSRVRPQARLDLAAWQTGQYGVVGLWEPAYPRLLREIWDPPFLLWFRGQAPGPDLRLCAVVGTRQPTEAGRRAAWEFALSAARLGVGVVSGLAYGIDGAAHAGALDGGGYTIAVLAGGIDRVIPGGHRQLARRLLAEGSCLVSEFAPGVAVQKYFFPRRNRIISGLAPQLLVVEAPQGSGALISARQSLEEGRDVFIHRACLESCQGEGIRDLASLGAVPVVSMDELLQS